MSESFIGEIRIVSFGFAPGGWALCNGQIMPISQNQPLYSVLGTTYGGDGQATFALPDLQGRTPFHVGTGFALGQQGGEETHMLTIPEMPGHTHAAVASSVNPADQASPTGGFWANSGISTYSSTNQPQSTMSPFTVNAAGENQPHQNLSPYLVLNFVISLQGFTALRS
jgi:microcystin-dependent protein